MIHLQPTTLSQSVIESARAACFNSGQRVKDHFVEVADMIEVGSKAKGTISGHIKHILVDGKV